MKNENTAAILSCPDARVQSWDADEKRRRREGDDRHLTALTLHVVRFEEVRLVVRRERSAA